MLAVDLIATIHIDDKNTRFIELLLRDHDLPVLVDGCTATARFVTKDKILLHDSVPCIAEGSTVRIPIPGISRAWGDVEIRPGAGKKYLTIPARSGAPEVYGKTVAILRGLGWSFASGRRGTPQEKLLFGRFEGEKESKVMKRSFFSASRTPMSPRSGVLVRTMTGSA